MNEQPAIPPLPRWVCALTLVQGVATAVILTFSILI